MQKKSIIPVFTILFFILQLHAAAQEKFKSRFKSFSGQLGFGNTFSDNTKYKTLLWTTDWSQSFKKLPLKNDFVGWYANPQFVMVKATNTVKNMWDIEFGLNLGIRNFIRINDKFYLYQMLGSGPHYITARLDRQARGFIFSDNLALGSYIHLKKIYFLNLQFGIRHISNANIKLPNRGVNSYIFTIGLSGLVH